MDASVGRLLRQFKRGRQILYGDRFRGPRLFGSYARDEQDGESHLDLLAAMDAVDRYGMEISRTSSLTSELALKYGISISHVSFSDRDWPYADSPFAANAQREAVPA